MDERAKKIIANMEEHNLGPDDKFKFHCIMCGKCCVNRNDLLLTPRDIYNMSKELGIKPEELVKRYCEVYIGPDSRFPIVRILPRGKVQRCPLLKDRKCMVHRAKPTACAMYPIGRGLILGKKDITSINASDTVFFFMDTGCGDDNDSQEHTVREWLSKFGVLAEDDFFISWQKTVVELRNIFQEMEMRMDIEAMELLWNITIYSLYIDYDTGQDFRQQFDSNSQKVIAAVNDIRGML